MKGKGCFIQEASNLGGWWTRDPRPSLKCRSKQEHFKGEFHGGGRGLAVNHWLMGGLAATEETVCFDLSFLWGLQAKFVKLRKVCLEDIMEGTSCFKME